MRRYETTFILRPNLGEASNSEIIERTSNIIANDGGAIIWQEHWGVKKLAYEIKKESHGYYVYIDYAAPGSAVQEIERIFNIDDRVLRFLTVKIADSLTQEEIQSATENAAEAAAAKSARSEESPDDNSNDEDENESSEDEE